MVYFLICQVIYCKCHLNLVISRVSWTTAFFSSRRVLIFNVSKLHRPYIIRFITFSLLILPSTSPLLYSYFIAFLTASKSRSSPHIKLSIFGISGFFAFSHLSSASTFLPVRIPLNSNSIGWYNSLNIFFVWIVSVFLCQKNQECMWRGSWRLQE